MRYALWCVLFIISCVGISACSRSNVEDRKPNIVFILSDDMGWADLASYGRKDIRTPNIDGIAAAGIRFTNFYSNGAECTPTRAGFVTGRYPHRVGGLECALGVGNVGRYDDAIRLANRHEMGLPVEETSIARMLKDAGYATGITGKWHLGYESKFSPNAHGFDYAFYGIGGGMEYFHHVETMPEAMQALYLNGEVIQRDGYITDLFTEEAVAFIKSHKDHPFFLYLPYTCPHSPYQAPDEYTPEPLPADSRRWNQGAGPRPVYNAMIERMDAGIGKVLQTLDNEGLADNTVVIFTNDNGGTGSSDNGPLRDIKGTTFEGGIRVPAAIRWPGHIQPGTLTDQMGITMDFTASIARIAGATPPRPFDGVDIIADMEAGRPVYDRTLFWRKPRGNQVWRGARDGAMKFVSQQRGEEITEYLFDIAADISETTDLKEQRPEEFKRLRDLYYAWETEIRANRRGQE